MRFNLSLENLNESELILIDSKWDLTSVNYIWISANKISQCKIDV